MNGRRAALLGGALAALAAVLWLTRMRVPTPPAPAPTPPATSEPAEVDRADAPPVAPELPRELADAVERYREPQDPIDREWGVAELAASDDPAALEFLIDELRRAQGAEHRLLLNAVIDFGSQQAIPALRELAAASEDPDERQALVEAADYLALPSLTELRRGEVPLASDAER